MQVLLSSLIASNGMQLHCMSKDRAMIGRYCDENWVSLYKRPHTSVGTPNYSLLRPAR